MPLSSFFKNKYTWIPYSVRALQKMINEEYNNDDRIKKLETKKEELKKFLTKKSFQLCEDCQRRLQTNPLRIFDCKVETCQEAIADAPIVTDFICSECQKHFDKVKEHLETATFRFGDSGWGDCGCGQKSFCPLGRHAPGSDAPWTKHSGWFWAHSDQSLPPTPGRYPQTGLANRASLGRILSPRRSIAAVSLMFKP
jgi:uncharacterized protein YlaI